MLHFPRLNLFSWYFYVTGVSLVLISQFTGQGPPDTGWTFYAPYSFRTAGNMLPAVFGAFVLGFSSILTGLNFLVTIHRMRAPGMTWLKMPLFPWTLICHRMGTASCYSDYRYYFAYDSCRKNPAYRIFRSDTRRRSSSLPASFLDIQSSGSLYYDLACNGCNF